MGWVLMDSHTAPIPEYDNPENAYDGSLSSVSYSDCDKQDVGTYLYLQKSSMLINNIRLAASAFKTIAYVLDCDIDLYYNAQWNDFFDGVLDNLGSTWNEKAVSPAQYITEIRICSNDTARQFRLYEFQMFEVEALPRVQAILI